MARKIISPASPLALYNLISAACWGFLLYSVLFVYPSVGQPVFYEKTRLIVTIIQCGAVIEIVNSLLGIVRSPILTTVAQVSSRLLIVIGIFQLLPSTPAAHGIAYITLLASWSIAEIVRYIFYFFSLTSESGAPKIVLLLRYNLFWVLYPTGVASELIIIYSSLALAESIYSIYFKYGLIFAMLTYIPGLPILFSHMVVQRSKVMKSLSEESIKKNN